MYTTLKLGLVALMSLSAVGCGAAAPQPATPAQVTPAAPALNRSLFSKDLSGSVSEDDLGKILDAELQLEFPARLGVVALEQPFRAEAGATLGHRATIAERLTTSLQGSPHFSVVTDVSTDLPNPEGLEGLRTIAARYRLRYLLLTDVLEDDTTHLNNWAWLYATGIGILLAPGKTVGGSGLLQASLLDVRTGTLLYTVVEPFQSSSETWLIGAGRERTSASQAAIASASKRLAKKTLARTNLLADHVKQRVAARQHEADARQREAAARQAALSQAPAQPGALTAPSGAATALPQPPNPGSAP